MILASQISFSRKGRFLAIWNFIAIACIATSAPDTSNWFYDGTIDRYGYNYLTNAPRVLTSDLNADTLNAILKKASKDFDTREYHRACIISFRLRKPHVVRDSIAIAVMSKLGKVRHTSDFARVDDSEWLIYAYSQALTNGLASFSSTYRPAREKSMFHTQAETRVRKTTYQHKDQILLKASMYDLLGDYTITRTLLDKLATTNNSVGIGMMRSRVYLNGTSDAAPNDRLALKIADELVQENPTSGRAMCYLAQLLQYTQLPKAKTLARRALNAPDTLSREKASLQKILAKS